jgi:diguanylate cyclase (GGDEF)-like protein
MSHLPARDLSLPGIWPPRHLAEAELVLLRRRLIGAPGPQQVVDQVALAWALRQRDSREAMALAERAEAALAALGEGRAACLHARLALVRAEVRWLFAELDASQAQVAAALSIFERSADGSGVSDCHWLLAWIAADRGDHAQRDAALASSIAAAAGAGDGLRAEQGEAALARSTVFRDFHAAVDRWGGRYLGRALDMDPALVVWVADFCALVSSKSQRIGPAVAYGVRMHDAALATGQLQRAMTAASNIGFDLTRLNDLHAALDWMQQGLELARRTGWPASLAVCLTETAETLRRLGRLDSARALLDEALQVLRPLGRSRWYALALNYRGDLELDRGDHAAALLQFEQLRELADTLGQADLQAIARRGQAQALSHLDRPGEALDAAEAALALAEAQEDAYNQIAALRVIADIGQRHRDRGIADASSATPLAQLRRALAIAAGIEGYATPAELFEALARELAHAGSFEAAFDCCLQALDARDRNHHEQANQRAEAMQIQAQTAAARAEAEQQRLLAASEARRAETLQQTSATLQQLGAAGQAITATLDLDDVLQTLRWHVGELLEGDCFGIYLIEGDGRHLRSALLAEEGRDLPVDEIALDNPLRHAARCARERREIALDRDAWDADPSQLEGSLATLSALFAPLLVGERLLGVLTLQSTRRRAYGERERLIFRSLAAYGAIALDNASAYRQLAQAHRELRLLSELSAELQASPGLTEAGACLARFGPQLLPGSSARLWVVDADGGCREVDHWGGGTAVRAVDDAFATDSCLALSSMQPLWQRAADRQMQCRHWPQAPSVTGLRACLPMVAEGLAFGLLQLEFDAAPAGLANDRRQPLALALTEQTALALANLRLREALREQSIRDPLTGLHNRRYLDETLPRELARCRRGNGGLAVAMIDVDHFKRINDSGGHAFGDRVLQAIAGTLQAVFRRSDVVCRYGGEEFLVLLPDVGLPAAAQRVDMLMQAVRGLRIEQPDRCERRVSISVGLALFPDHGEDAAALLLAADAALYLAKAGGRDTVRMVGD